MKILLAEDDLHTREALVDILRGEGFAVSAFPHGQAGLEGFLQEGADLVILDVMMPQLSGYEVCKRIRKVNSSVPILFLSAKGEEMDKVAGLDLGADDYITKPFGMQEIKARLRALLRRARMLPPETPFRLGDWEIRPSELIAWKNDSRQDLSLLDCKVLRHLHRHAGRPLSRQQLQESCWGPGLPPGSRVVDVKIAQLRKWLDVGDKGPIQTVHGLGYRVDAES
ncbi:MAG: Alkaline phosphatase synthesis transcriptional regulatory protein phoP [Verrucomicrobiota bacterium]|jgi:DNA-binding response OmpR family regulator